MTSYARRPGLTTMIGLAFLIAVCLTTPQRAVAQAAKGEVSPDAPRPVLTYHGLVPGLDGIAKVREVLGPPESETRWYDYKLYYPAEGRAGMVDVVHMGDSSDTSRMQNVDAASVPESYETETAIREKLGAPEFELRMAAWKLLDYTEKGLRFGLTADGKTTGVAYFPHGHARVPPGERKLIDLSHLRQGPQPAPARPASVGNLKVGVSEAVISPQSPDWLPDAFTIHDDLKARTAVFTDGNLTVAIVGADLFGMGYEEIKVIRDAAKEAGIGQVIFAMSHTHSGADTIGVYGYYPEKYVGFIQQQVIKGITDAYHNLQAVKGLRAASKELPMDGMRVMGLIRNARNPGIVDPTVRVLQAIGEDDKPIATLIHITCHPESLEAGSREISADYPGYLCDQIKADGEGQPVFLNGALGGMVSGDNPERTHESSRETGLKFADIVRELIKTAQSPATFRFSADQRVIEIPNTNPRFKELFGTGLRKVVRGKLTTDMIYFQIGEAQIISLPGELLPEVSFEILEKMDGFPRMLVGLANDELGYMIPAYDFREGFYEESMSFGPATALIVRDAALRMLQGIR